MGDLSNSFPSWGETGSYPADGFFYDGGDQVNEKHFDALWNGIQSHIGMLIASIRDRIRDIEGDLVLDGGMVVSTGSNTGETDVSSSSAGAYVDGQKTGSTSATTLSHSANGSGSTRTDVVWVNTDGTIGKTEGATTVSSSEKKLAEVDVATDDTIAAVRNYARDQTYHIASENSPTGDVGSLWHDILSQRIKVYQNSAWRRILTGQDSITVTAGTNLNGGGSVNLDGGSTTINLDTQPQVGTMQFDDSDSDGSTYTITEDATTGDLEVRHGGAVRHELAQNGDVRIEGELTENASL